jgi:hypothetical protein
VHMLMGEDNAGVNLIAGDEGREETEVEYEAEDKHGVKGEYEWEYEDEGWWVGTVGAVEVVEWAEEASRTANVLAPTPGGSSDGVRSDVQAKQESDFQANESPEEEPAEDGWWDLELECPSLTEEETGAPQVGPPHHPSYDPTRFDHPGVTGRQRPRKRPKAITDQQWEEARQNARLRQMLGDSPSSEDEDEERHGRFAESGRWMSELYGTPQHTTTTSGGECSEQQESEYSRGRHC